MRSRIFICSFVVVTASLLVSAVWAKDYQWFVGPEGDGTSFADDGNWYDLDPAADPHNPSGPPTTADTADLISGANVHTSGGGVQRLTGAGTANFFVDSGSFTAAVVNTRLTLGGMGTLAGTNVMSAPVVIGGHLTAQTFSDTGISVSQSGSMDIAGNVSGQAGVTLNIFVDTGSSLTIQGDAVDVSGGVDTGAHATLHSLTNINTTVPTLSITGSGTEFNVVGTCLIRDGSLDVSNGAHVLVGGPFLLEGSASSNQNQSRWFGSVTHVEAADLFFVGSAAGAYVVTISDGARADMTGGASIAPDAGQGQVTVSGNLTVWSVTQSLIVSQQGPGSLMVSDGGTLRVIGSNPNFAIGQHSGANGTVTVNGGLVLSDGGVSLGVEQGSQGTLLITEQGNFGSLTFGLDALIIGEAGTGHCSIDSGGLLHVSALTSGIVLGKNAGASGDLTIGSNNGTSTRGELGTAIVGQSGTGLVNVTANGNVRSRTVEIGEFQDGQGTINITTGGTWIDEGTFFVGGDSLSQNGGSGQLNVTGILRTKDLFVSRAGTVSVDPSGQVAVGSGNLGPANSVRASGGGKIYGNGVIHGNVSIGDGGTISPGKSPGLLTIQGNYSQETGGTYSAEIGGTDPDTGFDRIEVKGVASLAGNLRVRFVNGFTPAVGQTFRILEAQSATGNFGSTFLPSDVGLSVEVDATGVVLTVTSVPDGVPVINSPTTVAAGSGVEFSYQIAATNMTANRARGFVINGGNSFGATNLPAGLSIDTNTGVISGVTGSVGTFVVPITATNQAGSGQADLTLVIDPVFGGALPPPSSLLNISTRMDVEAGNNALIGGFIVTGNAPKDVAIRGIGPSLSAFGISGVLADPTLELHGTDGSLIRQNDDWQEDPAQAAHLNSLGLGLPDPKESGMFATLDPGSYTAVLAGKNQTTGIGLVEMYDVNNAADSKLGNISTRGFVLTGNNVMVGGFILGGDNGNAHVVVRGIGPSLADFGLNPVLQDPTLELRDANGAGLAINDDWQSDAALASQISFLGLAPSNQKESGVYVSLPPGAFTAILAGKDGGTGIGLVEIYNVP